jgi:hypothetical protein
LAEPCEDAGGEDGAGLDVDGNEVAHGDCSAGARIDELAAATDEREFS